MTHWTWTYQLIDDDGNLSSRLIADHDDERVEEIQARFVEFLRGCGFAVDHHDDPCGDELSDVLQDRIQTALDYIDVMWPRMPLNSSDYHADLVNLTAILEGNQEANE